MEATTIINLISCIISPIIAMRKGFKPLRWILSFGIIGLVTVLFMPSARVDGITLEDAQRRAARANKVGAVMFGVSIILVAAIFFIDSMSRAKQRAAHNQIKTLQSALDTFKLDNGRYPTNSEGLKVLVSNVPGAPYWKGPYLETKDILVDPWNHSYYYESPGRHGDYDLYSLGADNKEGGDGPDSDIVSW